MTRPAGVGAAVTPLPRLHGLQAGRGMASLLVVLYHTQSVIALHEFAGRAPFGGAFGFGHAGVEFFFVLSGFIIHCVHRGDAGHPERWRDYLWKRVTRVYPLLFVVMLAVGAKAALGGQFSWADFLKTSLLIPQPPWPMLIQSWTLVHEMLFYLLFSALIIGVNLGRVVLAAWLLIVLACLPFQLRLPPGVVADFARTVTSAENLLFFAGIEVSRLRATGRLPSSRWVLAVGVVGFVLIGLVDDAGGFHGHDKPRILLFGLASALSVAGLVSAVESDGPGSRFAEFLGNLSYPLYLVHGAVISVVLAASRSTGRLGSGSWALVVAVLASVLVAWLAHRLVERPIASALSGWRRRRQALG